MLPGTKKILFFLLFPWALASTHLTKTQIKKIKSDKVFKLVE